MRIVPRCRRPLSFRVLRRAQTRQTPDAMARALQQRYQGISDFSADFVQIYRGGVLRRKAVRGEGFGKKPGRMRWTYVKPERKSSSRTARRSIRTSAGPAGDCEPGPAGERGRDPGVVPGRQRRYRARFHVERPPKPAVPGTVAAEAHPRRRPRITSIWSSAIDPPALQIRALTTLDRQGGQSTLTFTNLKENTGISDKEFAFRVPRGVDVITDGQRN